MASRPLMIPVSAWSSKKRVFKDGSESHNGKKCKSTYLWRGKVEFKKHYGESKGPDEAKMLKVDAVVFLVIGHDGSVINNKH